MQTELSLWLNWVDWLSKLLSLLGGVFVAAVTAFWAYTRFILERGLLPPSEFTILGTFIGEQDGRKILEITPRIKNVGSATLIVSNLRVDIRYLEKDSENPETLELFKDPLRETFGTLKFPKSLVRHDLNFPGEIFVGKRGEIIFQKGKGKPGWARVGDKRVVIAGKDGEILEGEGVQPAEGGGMRGAADRGGRGIPILRYDTFVQAGVSQDYGFVTAVPASATYVLVLCSFRYGVHPGFVETKVLKLARAVGLIHYSLSHIREPHTAQLVFPVNTPPKSGPA